MTASPPHPIDRFDAPMSITAGQPLKDLFDRKLVTLIAESFVRVHPAFDVRRFERRACNGLQSGTMLERAHLIGEALAGELPPDFPAAAAVLIDALGPERTTTEGQGLQGFFYMPHCDYVAHHGLEHFDEAMAANHELTRRFTSEFSVRPYLARQQDESLALFREWSTDANPHVRRLCSEGSRPRLPWASRLSALQADPSLAAPLLEALKDDPELYVRRSVANHLGDVCKDHPDWVHELCSRWLQEIRSAEPTLAKNRKWMIRHAVRLPAKKGAPFALDLRKQAKA